MIKSGYNDASKSVLETAENVLGNLKRVTFTAIVNHSFLLAPYIFKEARKGFSLLYCL